jgi:rhodanese-related sulfurtransferase
MKKLIISALLFTILLAACAGQPANSPVEKAAGQTTSAVSDQYTNISVSELEAMLKNKDFALVNVHVPFEGNIPDTDVSIPFNTIDQHLDQLPADKGAKIVLYCRSDRMSNIAAKTLVEKGYTNVYNLVGGFDAWEKVGLPLEK